jgi:hypothetical protein
VVAIIQTRRRNRLGRNESNPERLREGCIEGGCRGQVRNVDDGDRGAGSKDRHLLPWERDGHEPSRQKIKRREGGTEISKRSFVEGWWVEIET